MFPSEKRLKEMGHLENHQQAYFKEGAVRNYHIGDDHEPFLQRGRYSLSLSLSLSLSPIISYFKKPLFMVWTDDVGI